MKKIVLFLITSLMTNMLFAQTENYKKAFDSFQNNYNVDNAEAIFKSFAPVMQNALSETKTKEMVAGLKKQLGKIENAEFIEYKQETTAVYKAKFENEILVISFSLDSDNKINGLYFSPYSEPKSAENNSVNDLSAYPKEIGDIIFSKVKEFPNNTQLSIAVIQNGKTNYYGVIKQNDIVKPIKNQDKVFEIGSITKVFTSTVLASLVNDKKIKLTDNVNSYFSIPFKDNIKLSFEDLANHTSGMSRLPSNLNATNLDNPYKDYGKKELEDYLKNSLKLDNEPGEKYAYSNLGAGLLGYTLGVSQKMSFQDLLKKKVFDKYKMNHSYTDLKSVKDELVIGLNPNGEPFSNWEFDVLFPGGGILSTTEDLAKFAYAQFNLKNKELALTRKPTFKINDDIQIGLGWHILKSEKGTELVWHNGGTGGYSSSMVVNITDKTAVIILSNLSSYSPENPNIDTISLDIINELEKK